MCKVHCQCKLDFWCKVNFCNNCKIQCIVHFENLVHFQCKAYIMCKVPFCACAACTFNPKNNFRAKITFSAECTICYKMHIFFAIPTPSEKCIFSTRCTFCAECIFSANRSFIANCPLRAKSTFSSECTQPRCSFAPSALCIWFSFCIMCTFNAKLTVGAKCSFCENCKFQSKACFEYFDSFFALIVQSPIFCTFNLHFNPRYNFWAKSTFSAKCTFCTKYFFF